METKTIKKAVDINAPKEKVWDVLLQEEHTNVWYREFGEGSQAQTDWQEGSKAIFSDAEGRGMVNTIITNKPAEELSMETIGVLSNGREDYDSEEAKAWKGGRETYKLSEKAGVTHLDVSCDMAAEMYAFMSEAWERALQKIKSLAETA